MLLEKGEFADDVVLLASTEQLLKPLSRSILMWSVPWACLWVCRRQSHGCRAWGDRGGQEANYTGWGRLVGEWVPLTRLPGHRWWQNTCWSGQEDCLCVQGFWSSEAGCFRDGTITMYQEECVEGLCIISAALWQWVLGNTTRHLKPA